MQFSLLTITAILATSVLAAPKASSSAHQQVADFSNITPIPAIAEKNLAAHKVTPGPAANVPALTKRDSDAGKALNEISKRDITHLYICQDKDFGGRCQNLDSERQTCYNLYNGWNDVVTSLGPDSGTTCCLFDDYGCGGGSLCGIVYPGIWNLVDYGWNDRASAYRCW